MSGFRSSVPPLHRPSWPEAVAHLTSAGGLVPLASLDPPRLLGVSSWAGALLGPWGARPRPVLKVLLLRAVGPPGR